MSRYVAPAARAPSNTGITKRGSTAFRTASHRLAVASSATASGSLASTRAAEKRPAPYRSTMLRARPSSWSAKTTCSAKSRRATIGANADPTPPDPTTRILMGAECSRRPHGRSAGQNGSGEAGDHAWIAFVVKNEEQRGAGVLVAIACLARPVEPHLPQPQLDLPLDRAITDELGQVFGQLGESTAVHG